MSIKGFNINGVVQRYDYDSLDNKPTIPSGNGLTEEIKAALLKIAEKVSYVDTNGATYYQDLVDAFDASGNHLVSINASYTQTGVIYDTDSLSIITERGTLVVTANYSAAPSETVSTYELSGTLAVGTSAITVTYGTKTTTFNVTVTDASNLRSVSYSLTGCTSSNNSTAVANGSSYTATITAQNGYTLTGATVSITMGGVDITSTAYSSGTISIASVTGDVAISVSAVESIVLPSGYTRVGWVSNAYPAEGGALVRPTLTMPFDDILELQCYRIGAGGAGQAIVAEGNASSTHIGLYNGGIFYDIDGDSHRAGFLAIDANTLLTLQIGNHYILNVDTSATKSNTYLGTGDVTWGIGVSNASAGTAQEMHFARIRQIHDGAVVKDYIPCVEDSSGLAGYYDIINNQAHICTRQLPYEGQST